MSFNGFLDKREAGQTIRKMNMARKIALSITVMSITIPIVLAWFWGGIFYIGLSIPISIMIFLSAAWMADHWND